MPDILNSAQGVHENETAEDRTLVLERVFRASPEKVFEAWTDPAILVKWWGPAGYTIPECELDARPNGAWRTVMLNDEGSRLEISGVYREVRHPSRLVMTWAWTQPDGGRGHETEIVVTLENVPEGTRLKLVQSVFDSIDQRNNHNMGWTAIFDSLDAYLG